MDIPLHSYVLSQTFGLYLIILPFIFSYRPNFYRLVLKNQGYPSFLSCSISLLISIMLVFSHNIWILGSPLIVTLLCWIFLIRTILWIAYPDYMYTAMSKLSSGKGYYVSLILMAGLGVFLLFNGTMRFITLK